MNMLKKKALISVSNKEGLKEFAETLSENGFEIISTGGTAKAIEEAGIKVTQVSDLTGMPYSPDGLVKTLHPKIHFALLMDRENKEHLKWAKEQGIKPIDLVAVNLYPFEETAKKTNEIKELIANIDIGGPAMIRASAKNHKYVAIVTDPKDYSLVSNELKKEKKISEKTKQYLAAKAFEHTANYDSIINSVLDEKLLGKKTLRLRFIEGQELRYGENWHQKAEFYINAESNETSLGNCRIIHGKQMSFNNYVDGNAALEAVKELTEPGVAIIKHTNPCGYATDEKLSQAFEKAWQGDRVSSFGSVIAVNREFDFESAEKTKGRFIEAIIAPSFTEKALGLLKQKKDLRLIEVGEFSGKGNEKELKSITGGLLVQDRDNELVEADSFEEIFSELKENRHGRKIGIATEKKPELDKGLFEFAWSACKHVKSNAIVIARKKGNGFQLLGMGAGQPNRVDSIRKLAAVKARENLEIEFNELKNELKKEKNLEDYIKKEISECVLASDAFFPFKDSVEEVESIGITHVIQPGGSIKDDEVIEACNEKGISMLFTAMRHFKH